ncbi:MAG TPA: hypothetical protein VF856_11485, partial [Gemmatimonadaceae bacterium]
MPAGLLRAQSRRAAHGANDESRAQTGSVDNGFALSWPPIPHHDSNRGRIAGEPGVVFSYESL